MSQNNNVREINTEIEPAQVDVQNNATDNEEDVTIWKYNGFEFSFDVGDADDAAHFEEVMKRFQKAENSVQKVGELSERIIAYDKMFRDMYDDLFGEGAGDDILGEKRSMRNCDNAYESFLNFIDMQNADMTKRRAALAVRFSYAPNRAQRRADARSRRN